MSTRPVPTSAFEALCRELRADRGRPAFINASEPGSRPLMDRIAPVVAQVVSLGDRVARREHAPTSTDLLGDIGGPSTLLVDIDVLFAPALHTEVMSQLRRISHNTALIVVWPGRIAGERLSYSRPGRADHVDEPARDLIVLRPVDADFPDEVPYTVERYPA